MMPFLLRSGGLRQTRGGSELYRDQGRYPEGEPLYKRTLVAFERVLGKDHPHTLTIVNNLASFYESRGEAEPLYKRALEARERVLGPEHPGTLASVNNLAEFYRNGGRYREAEPLYKHALEASERVLGPEHPETLTILNNLAILYHAQGRYREAEPLYERALEARERMLGPKHPETFASVSNLASLYHAQGRYREAEPLNQRVLEARERVLGRDHPDTLTSVNNLAALYYAQRDWTRAAQFWRRSTAARAKRAALGASQAITGKRKSESEEFSWQFWSLVKVVNRLPPEQRTNDTALAAEMFQTAQWAISSEAAQALTQMAARGWTGNPALSVLARERQDLVFEWQARDGHWNAVLGQAQDKRNAKAEAENLARLGAIDRQIVDVDKKLSAEFRDYAVLASPAPVSVADAQAQLRASEALVLFLDTPEAQPTPEETFVWVVTKTEMRWVRSAIGTPSLSRMVSGLRCGLDAEEWSTPSRRKRCTELVGLKWELDPTKPLPFDLGKAYDLYEALFGQVEDMIKGKRLLIVPSGPLTSLPFQVLVTKKPETALLASFDDYRNVAWFGKSNAISVLPAVSSLKALRERAIKGEKPSLDYVGYGNPILRGGKDCKTITVPEACPVVKKREPVQIVSAEGVDTATIGGRNARRNSVSVTEIFAQGAAPDAVIERVRALCPLPDTAYEIKCVSERFRKNATLIRLDKDANKPNIMALNASGALARYRIVHFATHGLLSGDVAEMARKQGEPALVLTPPDNQKDTDDTGLLLASDVAQLKLNADWVVLSACNTAAGDTLGAETLSGLARAFFYAGSKSLLVSHWPVYSQAAVRLTTRAFAELDENPQAGRAEALQSAMIDLMVDPEPRNAHPAVWAPFSVVGEGGR